MSVLEIVKKGSYGKPPIVSHRGSGKGKLIAENSAKSFPYAEHFGFHLHEIDVRITKDQVPVLFHGPLLQQYGSSSEGKIEFYDWAEVRDQKFKWRWAPKEQEPQPLTTLDQFLQDLSADSFVNIELKRDWRDFAPGLESAVVKSIEESGKASQVFFSSFNLWTLIQLRFLSSEIPRGLLIAPGPLSGTARRTGILTSGATAIHAHYSMVTDTLLDFCKKNDMGVLAWTVNDVVLSDKLLSAGVNGVITDEIETFSHYYGLAQSAGSSSS